MPNTIDKSNPLVSIICGFYNRQEGVQRTLESLIAQTYDNLEIIVFDDCSSDNTLAFLKQFQDADPRVRIIAHEKNLGFVNGLINAINSAKGDYIAIQGAGDVSLSARISEQVNYMLKDQSIGAVSSYSSYKRVVNDDWYVRKTKHGNIVTSEIINDNPIVHGAAMIRRSYYEVVGGYRSFFKYSQDRDLWTRLSLVSQVHVFPSHLYITNPSKNGVSVVNKSKILQKYYSKFVNQLIRMRQTEGYDFVDLFGEDAKFFMNPFPPMKNFRLMGWKQLFHEKLSELDVLLSVMRHTDRRLITSLYVSIMRILSSKRLSKYTRSVIKMVYR